MPRRGKVKKLSVMCASPGGGGNAFEVKIGSKETVSALKDAIKEKKPNDLSGVDADKLQLFLAKTAGGQWLMENDVMNGESDTSSMTQLKVAGAKLQAVGLASGQLGEVSDKDVAAGRGPVHVLVVSPEVKISSSYAEIASTLFQYTFLNVPSTTASRTQKLKKQLVKEYECDCGRNQNGDSMLLCMVMNIGLPSSVVIASHIFRREHDRLKGHFVQIADIDDVRNGLLLFKPIESAFDDLDIALLVDKQDQFTLKIFNPTIKAQMLVDSLTQQQWDVLGGGSVPTHWRTSTSPIYAPNAPQFNVLTTFGELDGKTLWFPSGLTLRPFRRCLYHQAQLARTKAITQGWVPEDYNFDDFSSEGFTLQEKMKLLFSSNLSISGRISSNKRIDRK